MTEKMAYATFTDRHRGSRELIKSRLETDYLRFVDVLRQLYPDGDALDLGSGRGEWLEILQANGFHPRGIDLDDAMLDACRERGFRVEKQDAARALDRLADESLAIVSAFHLIEHLPVEQVQPFMQQALRVLKPGGLLIIETPNPENILVSTNGFYMDPTHQRPVPMYLLAYLSEYCGFARTRMLRLHEAAGLASRPNLTVADVLGGVSPDYAIVAQKAGSDEQMALTAPPFARETGVTLEMLAFQYERQTGSRFEKAEFRMAHVESIVERLALRIEQAESRAAHAEAARQALQASRSWRITKPLRTLAGHLRRLRRGTGAAVRIVRKQLTPLVLSILSGPYRFMQNNYAIRRRTIAWLRRFPRLEAYVRRAAASLRQAELRDQVRHAEAPAPPSHVLRIQEELIVALERRTDRNH